MTIYEKRAKPAKQADRRDKLQAGILLSNPSSCRVDHPPKVVRCFIDFFAFAKSTRLGQGCQSKAGDFLEAIIHARTGVFVDLRRRIPEVWPPASMARKWPQSDGLDTRALCLAASRPTDARLP